jgi:hypothetical protein
MKENSKREIRNKLTEAFNKSVDELKIVQPSERTRKMIVKVAKRVSRELRRDLKSIIE